MTDGDMTQNEILKLTLVMEQLTKEVSRLTSKMERLQEEKVHPLEGSHLVLDEKVSRLSSIVYGTLTLVAAEAISIIGMVIAWAVNR